VVSARGKTANATRTVVLPSAVLDVLRPLAGDADAWMFGCTARDGKRVPHATGILGKPLNRVVKRLSITKRITPYAFRRTFNTIAMATAPAELVRKVIGHADASMTRHYLAPDHDARRRPRCRCLRQGGGGVREKW
jgi:integrase